MRNNALRWATIGLALALVVAVFGPLPARGDGVGIFPTEVAFEDTLREGEYFRTIGVINGGDADRTFNFESGGDMGPWIDIVDINDREMVLKSIVAPPNDEARALLRLRIPEDASNGSYDGFVDIVTSTEAPGGGGAGVAIGAAIHVTAMVSGKQVIDGTLVDVLVNQVELGSPLRVKSVVRNSGNVYVEPQLVLEVLDFDGASVFHQTFVQERVFPDETGTLVAEWDTTGQELGDYTVKSTVSFGDFELGGRDFDFTILPFGTLTRQGQFKQYNLSVTPEPGGIGLLQVFFINTGQIDTLAKFTGQLYFGERLVDVITSEELLVLVGEQKVLTVFPRAEEAGEYTIRGTVNYEGKETDVKELKFTAVTPAPATSEGTTTGSQGSSGSEGTSGEGATSEGTTSEGTTSEGTSSEGTSSETATSPSSDDGGVGAWLWIVIAIAAVAATGGAMFVGRKFIPGMRPAE